MDSSDGPRFDGEKCELNVRERVAFCRHASDGWSARRGSFVSRLILAGVGVWGVAPAGWVPPPSPVNLMTVAFSWK